MRKLDYFVDIAYALRDKPISANLHFSFILRKNRILSIGFNNKLKSHPVAHQYGYTYPNQHSELSSVVRYDGPLRELKDCTLINLRITKFGKVMYSKPCVHCKRLIEAIEFKAVYFTNKTGQLEKLI